MPEIAEPPARTNSRLALQIDRNAARLHLAACGWDYAETARAFDMKEKTLREWSRRFGWNKHRAHCLARLRDKKEQAAVEIAVASTVDSIASLSEKARFAALKLGLKGIEDFTEAKKAPENWQEAKIAVEIAGKAAGWNSESPSNVAVQVLFDSSPAAYGGAPRTSGPVVEAEEV